jgi:serralysin
MRKPAMVICLGLLLAFTSAADNPTYLPTRIVRQVDAGEGPITTFVFTYTYDGRRPTRAVSEQDLDRDGIVERRTVTTYTYDADGNRISAVFEEYALPDGTLEARSTFTSTYDENGHLLQNVVERDSGGDGTIDYRSQTTRTYDSDGQQIEQIEEFDTNADSVIDRFAKTTFAYDERGNLVQRRNEVDGNADGVVDGTSTRTYTYDRRDNLILEVRTDDGSEFTLTTRYTRDARGNAVVTVVEIDWEGDGIVDETTTETSTFNKQGQLTTSITEYRDGEGVLGTTRTTYSYNAHGKVIQVVREHAIDGNGTSAFVDTTTYTYAHVTGK